MTRARMLSDAEGLVSDANAKLAEFEQHEPSRSWLARAILDDTVRAYALIAASPRLTKKTNLMLAALYVRARVMTEALRRPVQ